MQRDFKGVWIPREIWLHGELSITEKALLAEIYSLDNESGCWASNAYFAKFFKLSVGRISKIISSLNDRGFISVKIVYKPESKQVDRRIIRCNFGFHFGKDSASLDHTPVENDHTPPVENDHTPLVENDHTPMVKNDQDNNTSFNNTSFNNTSFNNTPNNPPISSLQEYGVAPASEPLPVLKANQESSCLDAFETFWAEYPRKIGKKTAYSAWKRAKDKPSLNSIVASLSAQKQSLQWRRDGGKYIPHPTTWINRGGWDDEVDQENEDAQLLSGIESRDDFDKKLNARLRRMVKRMEDGSSIICNNIKEKG